MANANALTQIIPQILAQGLMSLRSYVVMPAIVNSDYNTEAATKGSTIDVPIPSSVAVIDVDPGPTATDPAGAVPTTTPIALDRWKEAPFFMTDKDLKEAISGHIPMQANEAIKAIAEYVNADIMSAYKGIYGFTGTPGTTPFASSTVDATQARKILGVQQAPKTDRRFVIDPDAEANALELRAFQDASFSGSAAAIIEGEINRKLGFNWFMDQQVPIHTVGTLSGTTGARKALVNDAAVAIGQTTIDLDDTALTGTIVEGDVFTVAGDTQTYVATALATAAGNAITGLAFAPAAKVAWADNAVLTLKDSHTVNLAFHRDAFAFASRPLLDVDASGLGSIIQSATDPVSGIALRLEVRREHKRLRWSYDILYGRALVRKELAARVAG